MQTITLTMQHTPDSIKRLSKVQYNTFHPVKKVLWYLVCMVSILAGLQLFCPLSTLPQFLFLAFGGIGIMNVGATARMGAQKTLDLIKANGNHFPSTKFTFSEKVILIQEQQGDSGKRYLQYRDIFRLIEDGDYFYLFLNPNAAHMVPKAGIKDLTNFSADLARLAEQAVERPFQLSQVNLAWIRAKLKKK